ncbi:hypothetical protein ACHQM5_011352 [Ranunculus cassubicifolius]
MATAYIARKLHLLEHSTVPQTLNAFTTMFELKQFHPHILKSNLPQSLLLMITTKLLTFSAISSHGDINYAKSIFKSFNNPTQFMYNTMIRGFSQSNEPISSFQYYVEMLENGMLPDYITFPFLIRSCSTCCLGFLGQQVHGQVARFGFSLDVFVVNNLISMYGSCGELDDARRLFEESCSVVDIVSWTTLIAAYSSSGDVDVARKLFDQMPCRNTVSWNAMVSGYACSGRIVEAREVFDEMPEKNSASWSAMISGYSKCRMAKEALVLFREMIRTGAVPNEAALVSAVSACGQRRVLEQGEWLHSYIEEQMFDVDLNLGTALVDMYGKCGHVGKAFSVFREMRRTNVMTWNTMITGMLLNGCGKQALSLFWKMLHIGPPPNSITFIGLLTGCSHAGMVEEGRYFFHMMTQVYQIEPQLQHYGCMVDLLGRAGLIKEALDFVERMPVQPHPGLLGALVGACRIHGEVELGEELGKQLVELEPQHSGRYMLLSNMFAAEKRWDDVAIMGKLLKERKVLKTPGNSVVGT